MTGLDSIPLWLVFLGTMAMVLAAIETGHQLGTRRRLRSGRERDNATSVISAGLVGLNSFFLAFTFGMSADRYESRQSLVRDDANAIRMAFLRTDLLQDPGRSRARDLLRAYLDERVQAVARGDIDAGHVADERKRMRAIQQELWSDAIAGKVGDPNTDPAAAYLDSLGNVFAVDARRWAVGYQSRLPGGVWGLLAALNVLGMLSIGFLVGNSGSSRSFLTPALAVAFATIITLIAALDRPDGHVHISQQPLLDLQVRMAEQGG